MDVDNDIEEGEFLHTFLKSDDNENHQITEEHHFDEEMPTPPTLIPSFLTGQDTSDLTERWVPILSLIILYVYKSGIPLKHIKFLIFIVIYNNFYINFCCSVRHNFRLYFWMP